MYEDCPPFFFFFSSTVHLPVSHVSFAKGHLPKRFGHKKEWEIGCSFWFFFPLSKILAPFAPVPSTLPLRVSILSSIVFFLQGHVWILEERKKLCFFIFLSFFKKKKIHWRPSSSCVVFATQDAMEGEKKKTLNTDSLKIFPEVSKMPVSTRRRYKRSTSISILISTSLSSVFILR